MRFTANSVFTFFVAVLCVFSSDKTLSGQDEINKAFHELNRIQSYFSLVRSNLLGGEGLAFTDVQKAAFAELDAKRTALRPLYKGLTEGPTEERLAKTKAVLADLKRLHIDLTGNVLLPHQLELLKKAEFDNLLIHTRGNLLAAIDNYYEDAFELSDQQRKKLKELEKEVAERRKELAKKSQEKSKKLEEEMRLKFGKVFTPEQLKLLEEMSGTKFSEENNGG